MQDIMEKAARKTKIIRCSDHGDFESKMIPLLDRETWTKCPRCHAEYEKIRSSGAGPAIPWLSKRRAGMTLENYFPKTEDQKKIYKRVLDYVANFSKVKELGSCLCMLGSPGTGKTHLATAMGVAILSDGYSVSYERFYDLMIKIKSTYNKTSTETEQEIVNRLVEFDLLIIDEVGLKTLTETEAAIAYQIIDKRYEDIRPTIIISNLSEKELSHIDSLGLRTVDRFYENHGAVFVFNWDSHRRG